MGFGDDGKENFSIKNGKAFTEDNVLVYNVFVYNIPKEVTRDQTFGYFKKFGEIKSVRLMNDRKRKNAHQANKIGFVNFCDPTVAAKVLQNNNHLINKKRIRVRACDSWHQPGAQSHLDADEASGSANDSTGEFVQESQLLQLNDDCLENIFKYLPMVDKINTAQASRRLRDVFIMHSKIEYKKFRLYELDLLTLWQTRQFLEMAGPQIEILEGQVPYKQTKRIIEFLGTFCTNVKNVGLIGTCLKAPLLRKLLKKMTNINTLELNDTELCDSCIPVLKSLPNLKVLSLEDNCELTGRFIKDLTNIETLRLNGCRRLASRHFVKICESLSELNVLEIHDCPLLKTADIKEIVQHLQKLETLKISSYSPQTSLLAQLPKLKHLMVTAEFQIQPIFFAELAKHKSNLLESLCIDAENCLDLDKSTSISELKKLQKLVCPNNAKLTDECLEKLALLPDLEILNVGRCTNFTSRGMLALIKSCRNLHTLNIGNCKQLKESFAKDVLNLLKTTQVQRDQKKPLTISACHSGIGKFVVNTPEFESSSELVKFRFDFQFDALEDFFHDDFDDDDYDNEDDDFFLGMDDDEDDDYYMYYSDPDEEVVDDVEFQILRQALFGAFHRYGDDIDLL